MVSLGIAEPVWSGSNAGISTIVTKKSKRKKEKRKEKGYGKQV